MLRVTCLYSSVSRKANFLLLNGERFHNLTDIFNSTSSAKKMGNFFSDSSNSATVKMVQETVSQNCVVIFSKNSCPYCKMAKDAFQDINVNFKAVELDQEENGSQIQAALHQMTGARTVPRVFVNGNCIGGGTETRKLKEEGKLLQLVQQCNLNRGES